VERIGKKGRFKPERKSEGVMNDESDESMESMAEDRMHTSTNNQTSGYWWTCAFYEYFVPSVKQRIALREVGALYIFVNVNCR